MCQYMNHLNNILGEKEKLGLGSRLFIIQISENKRS